MCRKILHLIHDPQFIADTCTMVVFSWIVGMIIEMGIAGMSLQQSLQTRVLAMGTNILTGGLNGKWLNRVRNCLHAEKSFPRSFVADVAAFATFQAILYMINLTLSGATCSQITKVLTSAAIVCGIVGKPYGLLTDAVRRLFRVRVS